MIQKLRIYFVPWKARILRSYYRVVLHGKDLSRLHIGCGDKQLQGFTNIDLHSAAADVRANVICLRFFPFETASLVYSNALFEHVGRPPAIKVFLEGCKHVLTENGIAMHLGIPNFREVARCYLARAPGIVPKDGGVFGLENVYRYTQGCPETAPSFMAQLHKDLYDAEKLYALGSEVFSWVRVIEYRYPGEPYYLCLGIFMSKRAQPGSTVSDLMRESFVYGVDADSIRFAS